MRTKEKILETAFSQISDYGYSGTSIRKIATEVGIRESAIYNHFKSKEEIFKSGMEYYRHKTEGTNLLTDDMLDELSRPEKFLKKFSEKLINHWSTESEVKFLRVVLREQFNSFKSFSISVNEVIGESLKVWEMIFTQMNKFGFIKKSDSSILANEFMAPLFFIRIKYLGDSDADIKSAIKEVNEHIFFFWNSIKK